MAAAGLPIRVVAIFGPTAVGKTEVAIELAELLRVRGEDPVAVNCDSIQVYRGLEVLSGAATARERELLEHRLLGFVDPVEEFSAGRYAELAHAEIDSLLEAGRLPIVVGGTGLYLRAALSDLDLRPPVPAQVRTEVEAEVEARGSPALHAELAPALADGVDPNDRKRVARLTELVRAGIDPHPDAEPLWTSALRHPTLLVGLAMDRGELGERISARVDAMLAAGAADEAREADEAGASRTARAALGFEELLEGHDASPPQDAVDGIKAGHRAYARRQLTWMRRMDGVEVLERDGLTDRQVAERIVGLVEGDGEPAGGRGG
jgi:tRNA dimethylallyltransferase